MATFRKYEFTPTQWATAKAKIETTTEGPEGPVTSYDPTKVIAVHEIGNICEQWGTDAEGNPVCEVLNPKWAVDILWTDEPMTTAFDAFVVWPNPVGVHTFAGWEQAYATDFCTNNPTAAYCQPPEPINP